MDKMTGPMSDTEFLGMMIKHHQAALTMSMAVLKSTKDAKIKSLATSIIDAQTTQISQMRKMLKSLSANG